MLKVTLVLLILTVIARIVVRIMAECMSKEEKLVMAFTEVAPDRVTAAATVCALLGAATIICAIITIVTW